MENSPSMRNMLVTALLIGFMGAAALGGCAGVTGEGSREHGSEGEGEESGVLLTLDQTYDEVRNGARLILGYDAVADAFVGTVQNVTDATLSMVRVEVHLSNGTELGPTTPVDLAPGATIKVKLIATAAAFSGWTAHPESGPGHGTGGEGGGEHGSGGEGGGEHESGSEGRGEHGG